MKTALKVAGRVVVGLIWLAVASAVCWGAYALITLDVLRPLWIFLGVVVVAIVGIAAAAVGLIVAFFAVAWCFGYGADDDGNFGRLDSPRRARRYWMDEE
jgi:hypothetical protein